jgi:hypothetical protein
MMLGLSRREIASRFDEIVSFAELEQFIDAPVKTYSSGMYMRLGFAVAINVDPDVLLVDEVLAVGDETFTHKCLDKFAEFRRRGKTVLLVTHSLDLVTRFCDEAIWLDAGRMRAQGDPQRVIDAYRLDVAAAEDRELSKFKSPAGAAESPLKTTDRTPKTKGESRSSGDVPPDLSKAVEGRWGSREVEIVGVELVGGAGPSHVFASGEAVDIRLRVRAAQPIADLAFGIGIFNADGLCCYGTNTQIDGAMPGEISGDAEVVFAMATLPLVDGSYKLDVAVHRRNGAPYDYHRLLHSFRVTSPLKEAGVFRPPHQWRFSGGIRMAPPGDHRS